MRDVVFWLPAINPYWADRLSALAERGEVSFECWFNGHRGEDRSWVVRDDQLQFPHTFLSGTGKLQHWKQVHQLYKQASPSALLTFHFDPELWPAVLHRARGRHLAYYCEMTWDELVKRSTIKEVAKHVLFRTASTVLTPGDDASKYVRKYGARSTPRLDHVVRYDLLRNEDREPIIDRPVRLLFLGRLIEDKGVSTLRSAIDHVIDKGIDIELRIVGNGIEEEALREWAARRPEHIQVQGFVQQHGVAEVLRWADVLLFPTHGDPYGLVVDEAFAAGVPVISSSYAGEIRERLSNGRGVLIDSLDGTRWATEIIKLAQDSNRIFQMSQRCTEYSKDRTPQKWASQIKQWLDSET